VRWRAHPFRDGSHQWWAHFKFTRINIEPIILRKKIEDAREAGGEIGKRGGVRD
jgi:hypothetical protein